MLERRVAQGATESPALRARNPARKRNPIEKRSDSVTARRTNQPTRIENVNVSAIEIVIETEETGDIKIAIASGIVNVIEIAIVIAATGIVPVTTKTRRGTDTTNPVSATVTVIEPHRIRWSVV